MSSPTGSISENDASLNKKRGRAQSQEPVALVKEDEHVEEKSATVSAPKKTKRDEESSTVSTIRKNMKDMTTTDKVSEGSNSHDDDEQMGAIDEEEDEEIEDQPQPSTNALAQFGGNSKNDDDWGEFAQDDDEEEEAEKPKEDLNKSKYTFGASSGFGTKGWAASHQTMPTPSKPTFGGFGSSSGFGGFKSAAATPSPFAVNNSDTKSIPSFSSFAKATTSPFAAAAAATGSNALSPNSTSVTSPTASAEDSNKDSDTEHDSNNNDGLTETPSSTTATFGEAAKVKVPGVKETKVTTGEENEDTICQTKGKLYVMDSANNWKERGVGTFRLNRSENESRLVMRTDSVYRLILNLKLFPGMKVFIMQEKFIRFGSLETETKEDGTSETKLVNYALKLGSTTTAKEIYEHIISNIPQSPSSSSSPNEL